MTRPKQMLFAAVVAVLVLGFIEGAARVAYRALYDRPYAAVELGDFAMDAAFRPHEVRGPDVVGLHVVHPYLGFVASGSPATDAAHGFFDSFSPGSAAPPDSFSVLLTGGSVALQVGHQLRQALARRLADRTGQPVRVRMFKGALGGYKQPQQLMTFNYLLVLGARFDLVINLDGYNEIALSYADNVMRGVHPIYPRHWQFRIHNLLDSESLARRGEVEFLRAENRSREAWALESPLAGSALVGLFLTHSFLETERRIADVVAASVDADRGSLSFEAAGPPHQIESAAQAISEATALWKQSSLQMHRLAAANGIQYLHVLQPNQYFEGTKPLSPRERRDFFRPRSPSAQATRAAYPLLLRAGDDLRRSGVDWVDASRIFQDDSATRYSDWCCHLTPAAVAMLVKLIADEALSDPDAGAMLQHDAR